MRLAPKIKTYNQVRRTENFMNVSQRRKKKKAGALRNCYIELQSLKKST